MHVVVVAQLQLDTVERLRNFEESRVLTAVARARMLHRVVAPAKRVLRLQDHEDDLRSVGFRPLLSGKVDALEERSHVQYLESRSW